MDDKNPNVMPTDFFFEGFILAWGGWLPSKIVRKPEAVPWLANYFPMKKTMMPRSACAIRRRERCQLMRDAERETRGGSSGSGGPAGGCPFGGWEAPSSSVSPFITYWASTSTTTVSQNEREREKQTRKKLDPYHFMFHSGERERESYGDLGGWLRIPSCVHYDHHHPWSWSFTAYGPPFILQFISISLSCH